MSAFSKEFEQYILSDFREECLSSLVPGGISEKYFNLCRRINNFENQDHEKVNFTFNKLILIFFSYMKT